MAALQHEAKEVDGEFKGKMSEVEADTAMIQEVGPWLPHLVPFPADIWARLCFTASTLHSSDSSGSSKRPL